MLMAFVNAALACLVVQTVVYAFPQGAPENACANLYPSSHGPSTAKGTPPYQIEFSSSSYKPKQTINVTLTGVGGAQFKGFLIEGRVKSSSATDPVGLFTALPSTAKVLCDYQSISNGVTHTNNTVKSAVVFQWVAPSQPSGDIVFHFTVVRGGAPNTTMNAADYFMDVKSQALPQLSSIDGRPLVFEPEMNNTHVALPERINFDVEEIPEEEYLCK